MGFHKWMSKYLMFASILVWRAHEGRAAKRSQGSYSSVVSGICKKSFLTLHLLPVQARCPYSKVALAVRALSHLNQAV
eukprot:5403762-Amphidinium_carterae.1